MSAFFGVWNLHKKMIKCILWWMRCLCWVTPVVNLMSAKKESISYFEISAPRWAIRMFLQISSKTSETSKMFKCRRFYKNSVYMNIWFKTQPSIIFRYEFLICIFSQIKENHYSKFQKTVKFGLWVSSCNNNHQLLAGQVPTLFRVNAAIL